MDINRALFLFYVFLSFIFFRGFIRPEQVGYLHKLYTEGLTGAAQAFHSRKKAAVPDYLNFR